MKYQDALNRLQAAQAFFSETSLSKEKFDALRKLLKGTHPAIDHAFGKVSREWDKIIRIEQGDVIGLVAHELPQHTEEEKKRKKRLLLFISLWKDLNKEVIRVKGEFVKSSGEKPSQSTTSSWGNILAGAKGPLGLVTAVAVGWVLLESTAVEITIANRGCDTMYPTSYSSIPLPGISLPKEPIAAGETGIVRLPPLTLAVDGTTAGAIRLSALNFKYQFDVPADVSVTFNGGLLNGTNRELILNKQKHHELVVRCK